MIYHSSLIDISVSDTFKFKIYLPSKKRYYHFNEITNKDYLDIVKIISNSDDDQLLSHFNDIIYNLSDKKVNPNRISRIDSFCILLNLYIVCVSNILEITPREQQVSKIKIDLYDILDKVTNFDFEYTHLLEVNSDIKVRLATPSTIYEPTADNLITSVIDTLHISGQTFKFSQFDTNQQQSIIDNISSDVTTRIIKKIKEIDQQYHLDVITYGQDPPTVITLNLYNNSMFELLKVIYNSNLEAEYYYRYFMAKHINLPGDQIELSTPAEIQTYLQFYKRERKEEEKAREKAERAQGGTVGMSPMTPGM